MAFFHCAVKYIALEWQTRLQESYEQLWSSLSQFFETRFFLINVVLWPFASIKGIMKIHIIKASESKVQLKQDDVLNQPLHSTSTTNCKKKLPNVNPNLLDDFAYNWKITHFSSILELCSVFFFANKLGAENALDGYAEMQTLDSTSELNGITKYTVPLEIWKNWQT